GKASALNCGLARERGTERTSTSRSTPASCNSPISSPTERLEWPIVKIVLLGVLRILHRDCFASLAMTVNGLSLRGAQRRSNLGEPARSASIHVLAAIDREGRAGDEIGLVRDQEQDGAGDVLGLAEAADRNPCDDLFENVLRHRAHHLGIDIAGRNGVDGD